MQDATPFSLSFFPSSNGLEEEEEEEEGEKKRTRKFKTLSKRRRSRIMKYPSIYAPSENGAFKRREYFCEKEKKKKRRKTLYSTCSSGKEEERKERKGGKKRDVDCHNLISRGLQKATRAYFSGRELYNKILATFGFLLGQVEWIADAGSTQLRFKPLSRDAGRN